MMKKLVFYSFISLLFGADVFGQTLFKQRATWDGPFDIKMIASANHIPVYIDKTLAATKSILADGLVSSATMLMNPTVFDINNDFANNPLADFSLNPQSLLCTNPELDCANIGLTTNTLSTDCNIERYLNPVNVTRTLAMTYSDYDTDLATFSSSMANLDITNCSEIEAAYLYWAGNFRLSDPTLKLVDGPISSYSGNGDVFNVTTSSGYEKILLKLPGQTLTTSLLLQMHNTKVLMVEITFACQTLLQW